MLGLFVGVAHAAEGGMPQFNPDYFLPQVFYLIGTVIVLHLLLTKIALPRITSIVVTREQTIRGDLDEAAAYQQTAQKRTEEAAALRLKTEESVQAIFVKSKEDLDHQIKIRQDRANKELAAISAEGERHLRQIQQDAIAAIESVAGEIAQEIASKILGKNVPDDDIGSAVKARLES